MNMLEALPRTPASHFRLHAYGAVLLLRARLPPPDHHNGLAFLDGYYEELTQAGFAAPTSGEQDHWWELVRAWERGASVHLPLSAARDRLGLAPLAMSLLLTVGLGEQDARFARLFEALNGVPGEARPTLGLLATWTDDDAARDALAALLESGLIQAANPEASRSRWALEVPPVLWEALRGRPRARSPHRSRTARASDCPGWKRSSFPLSSPTRWSAHPAC